jgi:hypothetical protein
MDHEYSILDQDRARIFQLIGVAITIIASAYTASIGIVSQVASHFAPDMWAFLPKALDVGLAFSVLYTGFNKWLWKTGICRMFLGFRNVSGEWKVEGKTLGPTEVLDNGLPRSWQATLLISQQWTKISVRLRTGSSTSFSRSAAIRSQGDETLLMYSYGNDPNAAARQQEELQTHVGYCEIIFAADGMTAQGLYFNNLGRLTHGAMTLTKV